MGWCGCLRQKVKKSESAKQMYNKINTLRDPKTTAIKYLFQLNLQALQGGLFSCPHSTVILGLFISRRLVLKQFLSLKNKKHLSVIFLFFHCFCLRE